MKGLTRAATVPRGGALCGGGLSSRLSVLRRRFRLEQEEEEPWGSLGPEGAGPSMTGGERAEQEEAERGLLTGQSSMRTHTSSGCSLDSLFFLRHVPFEERCARSSAAPRSLDSDEAERMEEEEPVRFQVPTRGRDVDCCCLVLTPVSRFQVPVRLKRDEGEGLSECERLRSGLRVAVGCGASGLDGESRAEPAWLWAESSSLRLSVGLGVSLMKVDCRTRAGASFCFFTASV